MKQKGTFPEQICAAIRTRPSHAAGPCLTEELLLDFYAGKLGGTDSASIREHLTSCSDCLDLARDARLFSQAMAAPEIECARVIDGPRSRWHFAHNGRMLLAAAALIIVVSGVIVLRSMRTEAPGETRAARVTPPPAPPSPRNPWHDLDVHKAEYVPAPASPDELIWRGEGPAPVPDPFAEAMGPYEKNDFGEAEQRLGIYLKDHPGDSVAGFYRGVSLLLVGRTTDAIQALEMSVDRGRGPLVDDARWYLALAHLKAGEFSKATARLDMLMPGHRHAAEARQLRDEVNRMIGSEPPQAEGRER